MEKKALKKILVMLIVFMLVFSNCGYTLQALATSDGVSFFGLTLFGKKYVSVDAYFVDSDGKEINRKSADVNQDMVMVLEIEPKEAGYLRTSIVRAITEEGEPNIKFKEIAAVVEEDDSTDNNSNASNGSENSPSQLQLFDTSVPGEEKLLQTQQVFEPSDMQYIPAVPIENLTDSSNLSDILNGSDNDSSFESSSGSTMNDVTSNDTDNFGNSNNSGNSNGSDNAFINSSDTDYTENGFQEDFEQDSYLNDIGQNDIDNNDAELNDIYEDSANEDTFVDEDAIVQEKLDSQEDNEFTNSSSINVVITEAGEISIENVIKPTKIYVKVAYEEGESFEESDLFKENIIEFSGTYINKDLEEITVSEEVKLTVEWTYSKDIIVGSEITKVSPFEAEGTKGTLIENRIIINRNVEDENYFPLKETKLELAVPEIKGKKPMALEVSAIKLKATKGEEINEVNFSHDNWEYDQSKGTITIIVTNPDFVKTYGEDIYRITYRYEEYVADKEISIETRGTVTVTEYSGKSGNIITKDLVKNEKSVVNVGELITYSIGTTEDKINKGKINANYNSEEAVYETEYTSTVNINILTNDVLKEFTLKGIKEFYVDNTNLEFEAHNIKYKKISFKYDEIAEMLKEGAIIKVKTLSGEVLNTLSSENVSSQENCEIFFENEITENQVIENQVTDIEISVENIKVNGNITVELTKIIDKCEYDKSAFVNFDKIESRIKAEVKYENIESVIELSELKAEKYFENSFTKAEVSINKDYLATILDNDDVEFKIELNNHLETSDLYVNPVFEIVFPKYIEAIDVKGINLLNDEGLQVKNIMIFRDDVLKMRVELQGTQTRFSEGEFTKGTNVIVNAKVIVNDYTPKIDDQIRMYYYNEAATNYESQTTWKVTGDVPSGIIKVTNGFDADVFGFYAPTGFITANGIMNYDNESGIVESIRQGEITQEIEMGQESRVAMMNLVAMNNTGNVCTDVYMIGRIPSANTTDVITGEKLDSNTDTTMQGLLLQDPSNPIGCDIYYSENPNANKTIINSQNGWTKTPEDMTKVKSFLIVPTSKVTPGMVFKFSYNFQIPANLPYEVLMYGNFGAYYNNVSDVAVVYETSVADKVELCTAVGAKVEATLSVDAGDGRDIGEARFLTYTLDVTNTGSIDATNIQVKNPIPDYTQVYKITSNNGFGNNNYIAAPEAKLNWSIDLLKPGETQTFTYLLKTTKLPTIQEYYGKLYKAQIKKDDKGYYYDEIYNEESGMVTNVEKTYVDESPKINIENVAEITVENLATVVKSNTVKNTLVKSLFDIEVNTEWAPVLSLGSKFLYMSAITNISGEDQKNVKVQLKLPETVRYIGPEVYKNEEYDISGVTYDEENRVVTFNFKEFKDGEFINAYVQAEVISGRNDNIENYYEIITEDGKIERSSVMSRLYAGSGLELSQTTNLLGDTVKEGENIEFLISIKNTGNYVMSNVKVKDYLPVNLLKPTVSLTGSINKKLEVNSQDFEYVINSIPAEGKVLLRFGGTVAKRELGETISNQATVEADYIEAQQTNFISVNVISNPDAFKDENINDVVEQPSSNSGNSNSQNGSNGSSESNNSSSNGGSQNNSNNSANSGGNNSSSSNGSNSSNNNNSNNSSQNLNNSSNNNGGGNNVNNIEKHSISGYVWSDDNNNSRKDENEVGISQIIVQLYKNTTVVKTTTTDSNGKYEFTELTAGSYKVLFKYDSEKYIASSYRAIDIEENLNSEAIEIEAGSSVSNTLSISSSDYEDINLGLQARDNFDLIINKYITSAKVITSKKEDEHKFDNLDLAKLEIAAKEVDGARVELTYNIIIENIGNVDGNVAEVVDYIGKDFVFEEGRNEGWYLGSDGNAYNNTLKDIVIKAGEKKNISIVLVRNMTSENTGVISNKVAITDAYNGNNVKEKSENNSGTQETLISIKTGLYISYITIIVLIILTNGITYVCVVNKNKINNILKKDLKKIYK